MFKPGKYMHLGISPANLFPGSSSDEELHVKAVGECCKFENFDTLELLLPHDGQKRAAEIHMIKASGKRINYNAPLETQLFGEYYPASDDAATRKKALEFQLRHVDYALESGASLLMMTGCQDMGEEKRPTVLERFREHFYKVCEYCRSNSLDVVLEPLERGRFKDIVLGPSSECADFIKTAQKYGFLNAYTMIDTAHLPLMGETFSQALPFILDAGMRHLHLGDAVMDKASPFYGHTHPPVGVAGGVFDVPDMIKWFTALFDCGYLKKDGSDISNVSFEIARYPGLSHTETADLAFSKIADAFSAIL